MYIYIYIYIYTHTYRKGNPGTFGKITVGERGYPQKSLCRKALRLQRHIADPIRPFPRDIIHMYNHNNNTNNHNNMNNTNDNEDNNDNNGIQY